ncbi:MAG: putative quinol monooxygenase [Burkholderiales bacterium]
MITRGLLVRLEAKHGSDVDVEKLLHSAQLMVWDEPATTAWFGVRFGRSEYGIFDVFPDETGREAHLAGPVARSLMAEADELFAQTPQIVPIDVLAHKLPAAGYEGPVTKGLLLTFRAKSGKEVEVAEFLREARSYVQEEPKTIAWFAIRLATGEFGIFDVFPDNSGRFAHLAGHVPRELAKHALSLLGSVPDMELLDVFAHKIAAYSPEGEAVI